MLRRNAGSGGPIVCCVSLWMLAAWGSCILVWWRTRGKSEKSRRHLDFRDFWRQQLCTVTNSRALCNGEGTSEYYVTKQALLISNVSWHVHTLCSPTMAVLTFSINPEALGKLHDALVCLGKFSEAVCLEASSDRVNTTPTVFKSLIAECV
jgi:hypothetical protein